MIRCSCGRSYNAEQFVLLPFVGVQKIDDGKEPSRLELRNCSCKSTVSVWLDRDGKRIIDP